MSMAPSHDLLENLLERLVHAAGDESLEVEFKSAQGGLPNTLWETVSAFANTSGGWILMGINQKGVVEGLANPSYLLDTFHSTMNNPTKINQPICNEKDAAIENIAGKDIIVIRIHEVPRQQKPIFINNNPYTGTFLRRHTGDYCCKKPEVDRMIREASSVGIDSSIVPNFTLDDISKTSLARYRRRHQNLNPIAPRNDYDDQHFLESIGGYKRDRNTSEEGVTVAGLLMLGTDEAIREWRSRHLIDYRLIQNEGDPDERWSDRIAWEGNLLSAFEAIYPRLVDGLTSSFQLQGVTRVDEGSVQVVLREAFVNLLVHADYSVPEASLILRKPSEFSLRNPGSSRVSVADLLHGDRSDPRNPDLVRMFRFIGLAEEAGTGMPKIIRAWRELGLEMPKIDVGTERYEFSLLLRQAHLLSMEDRRWLRNLGSQWNEMEQLALVHAKHHGDVDNATLSRLSARHPADVSRVLVNLRDRHYLQMFGSGRYARYGLGFKALAGERILATIRERADQSYTIPADVWRELLEIGAAARQQSPLNREVISDLVVTLCSRAALSLGELSTLLKRARSYLRRRIVPGLLASDRLVFLYPESPSHPRQRYLAGEVAPERSETEQATVQHTFLDDDPSADEHSGA